MTLRKRLPALLLALVLAVSLSGCTIPIPGFADYDVSGYVKALLDSSYHQENEEFMSITGATEAAAQQNNTDTVENAAVLFCNTYGLYPSDERLQELQEIMRTVYRQTQYTVKDEQKTDKGYYLEVEIRPIVNFQNRAADLAKLKTEAQDEAIQQNRSKAASASSSQESDPDGYDDEDYGDEDYGDYGDDGDGWEEEEPSSEPESSAESAPPPAETVDPNELYVEKAIAFCKAEAGKISYADADKTVTISLEILQTEAGELQLDMNQISMIDKTVVYLTK